MMSSAKDFSPDWASAPGQTIGDILGERNISIEEFASRTGQTRAAATKLLSGRSAITIGLARELERVLGASVEFWMTRDFQYRQRSVGSEESANEWVRALPLSDMVKFGWLKPAPTRSEELTACLKFFDVPSVAAWHRVYGPLEQRVFFKKAATFDSQPAAVAAWLRQGELAANEIECAPWSASGFEACLASIRPLTRIAEPKRFLPMLQSICAAMGVAVAIVRSPNGCHASGATRFVGNSKALLLLSFRYLSDDQFWFSFFHEAGHLLLHGHRDTFIEGLELVNSAKESEANDFASAVLIPPQHRPELLRLRQNKFAVARFARRMGVSPGIVIGQLQHYGKMKHNHFSGLKRHYQWE